MVLPFLCLCPTHSFDYMNISSLPMAWKIPHPFPPEWESRPLSCNSLRRNQYMMVWRATETHQEGWTCIESLQCRPPSMILTSLWSQSIDSWPTIPRQIWAMSILRVCLHYYHFIDPRRQPNHDSRKFFHLRQISKEVVSKYPRISQSKTVTGYVNEGWNSS